MWVHPPILHCQLRVILCWYYRKDRCCDTLHYASISHYSLRKAELWQCTDTGCENSFSCCWLKLYVLNARILAECIMMWQCIYHHNSTLSCSGPYDLITCSFIKHIIVYLWLCRFANYIIKTKLLYIKVSMKLFSTLSNVKYVCNIKTNKQVNLNHNLVVAGGGRGYPWWMLNGMDGGGFRQKSITNSFVLLCSGAVGFVHTSPQSQRGYPLYSCSFPHFNSQQWLCHQIISAGDSGGRYTWTGMGENTVPWACCRLEHLTHSCAASHNVVYMWGSWLSVQPDVCLHLTAQAQSLPKMLDGLIEMADSIDHRKRERWRERSRAWNNPALTHLFRKYRCNTVIELFPLKKKNPGLNFSFLEFPHFST